MSNAVQMPCSILCAKVIYSTTNLCVWPRALRPFAAEAWRRAEAGELSDEELYPGDAQWAGLYDRMCEREDDETGRRFQIAADHGAPADA